ncbi:hypothetical protein SAMN05444422_106115 [Halobiforma haloterrestris]|uniref:Uncharacterized protein n=1 Tax=Natronobacterium haloterrestre TaxID=148448 RepID=A0A1I1HW10_NATHA|nr:hypothetical protein [Halobiforma haloterrestris]SFC26148.1 hypothetical protein SAMN05444422_106115 [Halobiforma haloterrestris]
MDLPTPSGSYRRLVFGVAAVAVGAGYLRYRRGTRGDAGHESTRTPETSTGAVITERHATAALVRRRVDPDQLESVRERAASLADDGPESLLGLEGASTASLFLDTEETPELVWYVELPRSVIDDRDDPDRTDLRAKLEAEFPVSLADEERATAPDERSVELELLVHAAHPERPRTAANGADGPLVVAGSDDRCDRDVELVRISLKSGLPERLADRFAGITRRVEAGELELGPLETWSAEMLEAEEMYTESIFLERRADGYDLLQYMETEDMDGVYEAYYDTWNPVARLSELVVGRVLEEPDRVLSLPLGSERELLAHAVAPDRPRRPAE